MTIQAIIDAFVSDTLLPFGATFTGLAIAAFLIAVTRYLIWGSGSEEGRKEARRYMLWGLLGLLIVLALWGFLALLFTFLGIRSYNDATPCPDFNPDCYTDGDSVKVGTTPSGFLPGTGTPGADLPGSGTPGVTPGSGTPGVTPGSGTPGVSTPGSGTPGAPTPGSGTPTGLDYTSVDAIARNIINAGDYRTGDGYQNNIVTALLADIGRSDLSDVERARRLKSLHQAGIISTEEQDQLLGEINTVREAGGLSKINLASVGTDARYVATISELDSGLERFNTDIYKRTGDIMAGTGIDEQDILEIATDSFNDMFSTTNSPRERVEAAQDFIGKHGLEGSAFESDLQELFATEAQFTGSSELVSRW